MDNMINLNNMHRKGSPAWVRLAQGGHDMLTYPRVLVLDI